MLGFDELRPYLRSNAYFGGIIGRFANRIGKAAFQLNDRVYELTRNDGIHHLHGGSVGFDKVIWNARAIFSTSGPAIEMMYLSAAGDEGYPGTLKINVSYALNENELRIDYTATTDQETIVNLTNHSYFNLAGTGTILNHMVRLAAARFLPVDAALIPTGEIRGVEKTPFDFTEPTAVGSRIAADDAQIRIAGGYDHNFVLREQSDDCPPAAELYEPDTGRLLSIFTTQPGIQFYTGNQLDGTIRGKGGCAYVKHAGLCLETQFFPDSPNHPTFPSTTLTPGDTYRETTVYRFGVKK